MGNSTKAVAVDVATEYIRDQLINDKLIMADATEKLGWSFPRIRSRALTICKTLKGTFVRLERGVYMFEPNNITTSTEVEKESNVN